MRRMLRALHCRAEEKIEAIKKSLNLKCCKHALPVAVSPLTGGSVSPHKYGREHFLRTNIQLKYVFVL